MEESQTFIHSLNHSLFMKGLQCIRHILHSGKVAVNKSKFPSTRSYHFNEKRQTLKKYRQIIECQLVIDGEEKKRIVMTGLCATI